MGLLHGFFILSIMTLLSRPQTLVGFRQPTEYLVQLARAYQQGAGGNHLRFIYHEISKVEPSTIVLGRGSCDFFDLSSRDDELLTASVIELTLPSTN